MPSAEAYVVNGTWGEDSRKHPALAWMETYTTDFFDSGKHDDYKAWHTEDYSYTKADGTSFSGRDSAFAAVRESYAVFTGQSHQPYYCVATETKDGWEMLGQAHLYVNLVGSPAEGESKVTDAEGKTWDAVVPGAFHFWYVKEGGAPHGGIKLKKTEINSDSGPIIMTLIKRGVIKM